MVVTVVEETQEETEEETEEEDWEEEVVEKEMEKEVEAVEEEVLLQFLRMCDSYNCFAFRVDTEYPKAVVECDNYLDHIGSILLSHSCSLLDMRWFYRRLCFQTVCIDY